MNKLAANRVRNSNLELYRIIVMLLIVAHHYVVNSGLMDVMEQDPLSGKSLFYYWFGMWGKTGINCFVLITGYFMCQSSITIRKFLKLLLQIEFYKIVIYAIFVLSGYEAFSLKGLAVAVLPAYRIGTNFVSCFLFFYLCIPFLNTLIRNLDKKKHLGLLVLCLVVYTLFGTFPKLHVTMNYVSWFCVLYVLASYVRMYGIITPPNQPRTSLWGWLTLGAALVSIVSVITTLYLNHSWGLSIHPYRWVQDSNTLLAVITGVCSFMYFKDLHISYSPFVNTVGSCTFGVLLIHANSDTMRQWLWKDLLDNAGNYSSETFILHAILSVLLIFILCAAMDYVRQHTVEKWIFRPIDRLLQKHNLK